MSIKDMLVNDMKAALKAGDKERLSVIRMAKSAIVYAEKERLHQLTEEEVVEVLFSEIKKRKRDIEEYKRLGKMDTVESLQKEIDILASYLPEQLSVEELENIVRDVIKDIGAKSIKDMGRVMGAVMPKVKGKAEGSLVSDVVRKILG